jgi:phosphate transport system substrate-binding protein
MWMRIARLRPALIPLALVAGVLLAQTGAAGAHGVRRPARRHPGAPVTLLETGSTLLYPLFQLWIPVYTKANPNVHITAAATGSGTGISDAEDGTVQIGASDAYLPPGSPKNVENIALAISAQNVNYNLPGLNGMHLKFSGPVLAGIYTGAITRWNDPAIAKLNPGVKLPNQPIIPVRRLDGSGDTFIFTSYLTDSSPAWRKALGAASYGTTVNWPHVGAELGATGNSGMLETIDQHKYSIAYIGVSYANEVSRDKLGTALLENRAGRFVASTPGNIAAAASSLLSKTPKSETLSLIFAPGANSYPIINYEYAIVSTRQSSTAVANAVKAFLTWAVTAGNAPKYLNVVHFVPLPASVAKLSRAQINAIQ